MYQDYTVNKNLFPKVSERDQYSRIVDRERGINQSHRKTGAASDDELRLHYILKLPQPGARPPHNKIYLTLRELVSVSNLVQRFTRSNEQRYL
jgi:hypothetical protein